jgi:hypothetical protein
MAGGPPVTSDTGREPAEAGFQRVPEPLPDGVLPHLPQILRGELVPSHRTAGVALRSGSQAVLARAVGWPAHIRPTGRPVTGNGRLEGRKRGRRCACRAGMMTAGEGVAAIRANWLMLTPGLIFGTVLALICYRMPGSRASAHRHRRDGR